MPVSVEIPVEVQPLVTATVERGLFADEQEVVSEVLRVAMPALPDYQRLRRDVQASVEMADRGEIREADFDAIRKRLSDEYDESGGRR